MTKPQRPPASVDAASQLQADHWYRQVASATLAAGSAMLGASQDAQATLPVFTANLSTTANFDTQEVLYFDFLSGNSQVALNADPEPDWAQFAVGRLGDIASALTFGSGDDFLNRQFMGELSAFPPDDPGEPIYELPFRLAAGDVIGPEGNFQLGVDGSIHTMAQVGLESYWGFWRLEDGAAKSGYVGMRFSDNDGEDYRYGWAQVTLNADFSMTLHQFAYNPELNQPILAGQASDADFDDDLDVDGNDFLIWQQGLSASPATHATGDANLDGVVDADDLEVFTGSFGASYPGAATPTPAASIPEPNATSLLVLGAAGLGAYRARRRTNDGGHRT